MTGAAGGMRILHIESSKNWGGQEYGILEQIRWLVDHGHEAAIAAPHDSEIVARARTWGLPAHPVDFRGSFAPKAIAQIRRLVRSGRFDVIDVHGAHAAATVGCAADLCRVVRSLHVYQPQEKAVLRRLIWRWGCHHAVVRAHCVKDQLVALRFKRAEDITVVGSWAAPEFFHDDSTGTERSGVRAEWGMSPDDILVALVGMLRPDKGHRHFIGAAARYLKTRQDAFFLIVGEAPAAYREYEAGLRRTVGRLGLDSRVIFTGYRHDVARVLRAVDVAVIASDGVEAQPRMVAQAFAARVPLIAARVGGVPELVVHRETGWLVEIGDEAGTAAALTDVLSNRSERERVAAQARRFAERELTLDRKMAETLAAYDAGPRRPRGQV
ncbi:MAG: glycosyltransferase family 4 protein [Nitrospiria bacterium]